MEHEGKPKKSKGLLWIIWILTLSLLISLIYGLMTTLIEEESVIKEPRDFSNEAEHLYRWDLSAMYKDLEEARVSEERLRGRIEGFRDFEGQLNRPESFKKAIVEKESIIIELEKLTIYASLIKDADAMDEEAEDFLSLVNGLSQQWDDSSSFMESELSKLSNEKLETYMGYEEAQGSQWYLGAIRYERQSVNNKYERSLLSLLESLETSVVEPYHSFWSQFEIKQDQAVLEDYNSQNDEKREAATRESLKKSIEGANLLASILEGKIQHDNALAKAYGYDSDLEMVLGQDGLTKEQFEQIRMVNDKHLDLMHRWITYKKNKLKLDRPLAYYDQQLTFDSGEVYEFKKGSEMVGEAIKPLGGEVATIYTRAIKERWIDVYPRENKHTGSYTWGAYASHPFVLINYEDDFNSLDVLAHEMGHAIHGELSSKNQTFENASSGIFKAEIASTTNEVLFLEYALKNLKGEALREAQEAYVDLFASTMFEQMKATEFELAIHEAKMKGENLDAPYLIETWKKLNAKYYGSDYSVTDLDGYDWTSLDHLYWNFYMYKYATGLASGYHIAQDILQENEDTKKAYLAFLKSGSSKDAMEEIKGLGVTLDDGGAFEACYEKMELLLGALEIQK